MKKDDKYYLSNKVQFNMQPTETNINGLQNKLWYIIKHEEGNEISSNQNQLFTNINDDYNISLNDIIKLGRVKYSANEIKILNQNKETIINEKNEKIYNISELNKGTLPVFDFIFKANTIEPNTNEEILCKICISGNSDETNPLVELCKCIGGLRFAHYDCLKKWMQTKLSKKRK